MYAFDSPIIYPFYAFCRNNMKRFVNNEIAPCRVMFYNPKTVCKRNCVCNYVHLRFSHTHPPLLWAYNFIQHPAHFLWLCSPVQKQLQSGKIVSDCLSSPVSIHTKRSQVNFVLFCVGPLELLLLVSLCCIGKHFNMQGDPFGNESKAHQKRKQ